MVRIYFDQYGRKGRLLFIQGADLRLLRIAIRLISRGHPNNTGYETCESCVC